MDAVARRWNQVDYGQIPEVGGTASSRKALVVFDTMWQSTEKMARAVSNGLIELGPRRGSCSFGSQGPQHGGYSGTWGRRLDRRQPDNQQ